ncbi:hypothetical protein L249_4600, partial [Ophiocordyceps polyrhachis-furcata BCC 54312]
RVPDGGGKAKLDGAIMKVRHGPKKEWKKPSAWLIRGGEQKGGGKIMIMWHHLEQAKRRGIESLRWLLTWAGLLTVA